MSGPDSAPQASSPAATGAAYLPLHQRVGWATLAIFALFGLVLESLHGFKIGWYLNVSNEARRLMWTLAHAHGTLLALVNLLFGISVHLLPSRRPRAVAAASRCLLAATFVMPFGFFVAGLATHAGDPNLGVLLVPVGGVLLVVALLLAFA